MQQIDLTTEQMFAELHKPIMYECIGNESDFEQNIIENIDQICEALKLSAPKDIFRQMLIDIDDFHVKPDIIIRHEDETRTIIEVKKTNHKYPSTGTVNQMNAIGQLLLYGNVFWSRTGVDARLVLIDNKIYYRTYCAFIGNKLPIALVEFQKDRLFMPYNGWKYRYGS